MNGDDGKCQAVHLISVSGSAGMYNCTAKQIALVRAKSNPVFAKHRVRIPLSNHLDKNRAGGEAEHSE